MVKTTPELVVSGVAVLWSLSLPWLPDSLFQLLDTMVGVFVLLLVALLALPQGAVAGILSFVAIALTFVERNRRKVSTKLISDGQPSLQAQLQSAPPMSSQEIHPSWEVSHGDETGFAPEHDQNDSFEPVAASIDEKSAIPTIGTNEGTSAATRFFVSQHLARPELEN